MELLPSGFDLGDENTHLGTILIDNDIVGSLANPRRGSYNYRIWKKLKRSSRPWKRGKIENFPRASYHPWNLLRLVLDDAAAKNGGHI